MPRKSKRKGLSCGQKKKGTKDAKLAAARDADAKRMRVQAEGKSAQEKEKGKSRACGDLSSKPGHESHPRREKRKAHGAQHDVRALRVHAPHRQRAVLPLLSLRAQH